MLDDLKETEFHLSKTLDSVAKDSDIPIYTSIHRQHLCVMEGQGILHADVTVHFPEEK